MKKKHFSIISGAWCLVTLFGFANFLAFYYAGYKSKSKKYIFIGHIYLALKLASAVIKLRFFSSLISFLSITGYFFGIIFAFATIKAFYKRLKLLDLLDPLILNSKIKMIYTLDNQALDEFVKENEHFFEQTKPFSDAATKNNSYSQPYVSKADENEPAPELASDINDDANIDIIVNIIDESGNKKEIHRMNIDLEDSIDITDIKDENEPAPELASDISDDSDIDIIVNIIDERGNKKESRRMNIDNIDLEDSIDISDITKEIIKKAVTDIEKEIKYAFEDSENMVTSSSKTKMKKKK